jgi:hypothetical protein
MASWAQQCPELGAVRLTPAQARLPDQMHKPSAVVKHPCHARRPEEMVVPTAECGPRESDDPDRRHECKTSRLPSCCHLNRDRDNIRGQACNAIASQVAFARAVELLVVSPLNGCCGRSSPDRFWLRQLVQRGLLGVFRCCRRAGLQRAVYLGDARRANLDALTGRVGRALPCICLKAWVCAHSRRACIRPDASSSRPGPLRSGTRTARCKTLGQRYYHTALAHQQNDNSYG